MLSNNHNDYKRWCENTNIGDTIDNIDNIARQCI